MPLTNVTRQTTNRGWRSWNWLLITNLIIAIATATYTIYTHDIMAATSNSLILEQRPYLVLTNCVFTRQNTRDTKDGYMIFEFQNRGKTIAQTRIHRASLGLSAIYGQYIFDREYIDVIISLHPGEKYSYKVYFDDSEESKFNQLFEKLPRELYCGITLVYSNSLNSKNPYVLYKEGTFFVSEPYSYTNLESYYSFEVQMKDDPKLINKWIENQDRIAKYRY